MERKSDKQSTPAPAAPSMPSAEAPEPPPGDGPERRSLRHLLFGKPRDIEDPRTYHSIALIAVLAWVGLGADGLSSSAYGPDEAFRALGEHTYLAVALALATAITVLVISVAYSQIIKRFPFGGGGYVVATELLGPSVGVVSGSALLVDYVLTISVSIASGGDAIFSFLPPGVAGWKLPLEAVAIGVLVLLNLRGVKESVSVLAPIFVFFVVTHVDPHPRRHRRARDRGAAGRRRGGARLPVRAGRGGRAGPVRHLRPRLLDGRRHLHRHRGGLQRHPDHARAEGAHRPPDHDLHGDLAVPHRGRDPALLPALPGRAGAGQDHERGAAGALRRRLPPGRPAAGQSSWW